MLETLKERFKQWKYGDEVIVVSGLPRSGTSMTMAMLDKGGIPIMTDHEREADVDNPKGYYEFERVKRLEKETDKSWVQQARGKALKVISFLLKDLPDDNFYRVIFMHRDLDEIIASQNKMLDRRGEENDTSDDRTKQLYQSHLRQAKVNAMKQKNLDMAEFHYKDALEDPESFARPLNRFMGGGLDIEAMAEVVDPDLYRNRKRELKEAS